KAIPYWDVFGLHINQVGYQGQVLPMLVAAYILASIEKGLRKVIPTVLDNLLTPLLSIFITAFLTFSFVGPITRQLGYWLSDGLTWLYEFGGAIDVLAVIATVTGVAATLGFGALQINEGLHFLFNVPSNFTM
ncbi:PTS transporter subunit EIIC, partial [Listeria monocytogenes]|uniref:PTS transporter subunit EIIC n=1 Tax=Listeria monocytogenes TaxID=1639 RepID=UPI00140D06EA